MKRIQKDQKWKFRIRDVVKDDIAGFTGVIQCIAEMESGCTHYGVCATKLSKAGKEQWSWFDESRLVKTGRSKGFSPESWEQQYNLGDRIKDRHTGVEGIIVSMNFYATGCMTYDTQPVQLDRDGKIVDTINIPQERMILVKAAEVKEKPAPAKDEKTKAKKPPSPPAENGSHRSLSLYNK